MARKNSASANAAQESETETPTHELKVLPNEVDAPDPEPIAPPRASNELLPNVQSAAQTITGCSENEVKNFCATADYICRNIAVGLADKWKAICRAAEKNGKAGETASKVTVPIKVVIDQSNILMMDTKVDITIASKETVKFETQEDLRQITFDLS